MSETNMSRPERRRQEKAWRKMQGRINRELKRLARRDECSLCGEDFPHNSRMTYGLHAGPQGDSIVAACERCAHNVDTVLGIGLNSDRKYDFLDRIGKSSAEPAAHPSNDEIVAALTTIQQGIRDADEATAHAERYGGVKLRRSVSILETPWKADDRKWFEQHPGRSHRVRFSYPEEDSEKIGNAAPQGHVLILLIRQVEPGLRLKASFYLNEEVLPVPDDEAVAHALFDLVERGGPFGREEVFTLIERYRDHMSTTVSAISK